jgi:hypothetical protein
VAQIESLAARRGSDEITNFSLLGGPLYQLGRRLGLVRGETNTVLLGLVLGGGTWIVIVVLAVIGGVGDRLWSLSVIGAHARLLVAIPLFFVCESWVDPRMTAWVRSIAATGVVPADAQPALDAAVVRSSGWRDAWWPEALCLLAAVLLNVSGARLVPYGRTVTYDPARHAFAARVYFGTGLIVFQFLVFRWLWKLVLWIAFLWRVSRLNLHLLPGHPDSVGGLGSLEGIHAQFSALVAAISVLECASLVEDLSTGATTFSVFDPWLAVVLTMDAIVFLGPLFVFTDKLSASRTQGTGAYMDFAARYVTAFEQKWLQQGGAPKDMLGTPDLQSLADLTNSVSVVRRMRSVPIGRQMLTQLAAAALIPLLPLLLFKYPAADLAQKFFVRLLGL